MSDESQSRRWTRMFTEFIVIVVGVFLAVAAESWWAGREDRRFERELRDDIVAEFEANLRILESDLAVNDTSQVRMRGLEDLSDAELLAMPSEELTRRYGGWLDWAGFDPAMGIAQAFVESGNVSAVSDRRLRLQLSQWAGLLEEKRRYNLQAVDFQSHEVAPVIARATADLVWTESERRQIRSLLQGLSVLQQSVIGNQRRLKAAAEGILQYVSDR